MQAGLPLCCSQTSEDRFSRAEAHMSLASFLWAKGKQCISRSHTPECDRYVRALYCLIRVSTVCFQNIHKDLKKKLNTTTLKTNELVQLIVGNFIWLKPNNRTFEPWHNISYNVVCATSKGSDQPAHTRSLIRAFASHLNIL